MTHILTPKNINKIASKYGFKVTQFITDTIWVDIYGNKYYIDRTPIDWKRAFS